MAVENLAIISSSLAGLANPERGALGNVGAWMTSHGINPMLVGLGAAAGAIAHERAFEGAVKGAAIVGIVQILYFYAVR